MKILKVILLTIVIGIGGLLILAATKPDTFHVERSLDIKAPAAKIFPYLNDFRKGPEWSPWEKTDPQMKRTFSGAALGKGSVYEWHGNKDAGKGRMEITESAANSRVKIAMRFFEPMEGDSTIEYILTEKGDAINVRWSMDGTNNYLSKIVCIFMDMDKMIGGKFEEGLKNLETLTAK